MCTPASYSVYLDNKLLHENISAAEVLLQGKKYGYRKKAIEKLLKTNNKRFPFISHKNVKITKNFAVKSKPGKPRGPQILTSEKVVTHLKQGAYLYHSSFMDSIRLITLKRTITVSKELLDYMLRNRIVELDAERSNRSIYRKYYIIKSNSTRPSVQLELEL